jgi:hypothetical protein
VGYYEGNGLGLSATAEPPRVDASLSDRGGSYGFSGGGFSGGASLKVAAWDGERRA